MKQTELYELIARAEAYSAKNGRRFEFVQKQPASIDQLQNCESALGVKLPESLREFLLVTNGAELYVNYASRKRSSLGASSLGLLILDVLELSSFTLDMLEAYDTPLSIAKQNLFCFAIVDGHGDFCLLDIRRRGTEYPVLDGPHDDFASWKKGPPIAASFDDWLRRIFQSIEMGMTPMYWWGNTSFAQLENEQA